MDHRGYTCSKPMYSPNYFLLSFTVAKSELNIDIRSCAQYRNMQET